MTESEILRTQVRMILARLMQITELNQSDLAVALDASSSGISQLLVSDNMTLDSLARLGEALGVRFRLSTISLSPKT